MWSWGSLVGRLIAVRSQYLLLALSTSGTLVTFAVYRWIGARQGGAWLRGRYMLFGLLGYFLYMVALNRSFRAFDAASEPMVLNYTWPLFTVVFTRLLYERRSQPGVSGWEAAGVLLGLAAVVVLATRGDPRSLDLANVPGVLWGLGAGVSYGLFSAYSGSVSREEHGAFLFSAIAGSWILMAIASMTEAHLVATLTWRDVGISAVQGVLLNGVGYITWTRANRIVREHGLRIASVASLTFALPLLSAVWIALVLGERALLRPYFALSLLLIVASYVSCQHDERATSQPVDAQST